MEEALQELLKQGVGYALFVVSVLGLGAVIRYQAKRIEALQDKNAADSKQSDADLAAVNEKRLAETREVVLAMERNTASLNERTAAFKEQAAAIMELTKGFAALVLTQENTREQFTQLGQRLEANQAAILELVRRIVAKSGA